MHTFHGKISGIIFERLVKSNLMPAQSSLKLAYHGALRYLELSPKRQSGGDGWRPEPPDFERVFSVTKNNISVKNNLMEDYL